MAMTIDHSREQVVYVWAVSLTNFRLVPHRSVVNYWADEKFHYPNPRKGLDYTDEQWQWILTSLNAVDRDWVHFRTEHEAEEFFQNEEPWTLTFFGGVKYETSDQR